VADSTLHAHFGVMIIVVIDKGLEVADFNLFSSSLAFKQRIQLELRHSGFREASVAVSGTELPIHEARVGL